MLNISLFCLATTASRKIAAIFSKIVSKCSDGFSSETGGLAALIHPVSIKLAGKHLFGPEVAEDDASTINTGYNILGSDCWS